MMSKKAIVDGKIGIFFAFLAGASIAFFVIAINKAYAINKVGIVAPMVFGAQSLFLRF